MDDLSHPSSSSNTPLSERILRRNQLPGGTERILVIDDEPLVQRVNACELTRLGYDVLCADSGTAALATLAEESVDLVLLDLLMPEMDGVETYRQILGIHPGQKAIVYSGFASPQQVRTIQELGAGPILIKPTDIEELARAIREKLDTTTEPLPPDL